MPEKQKNRNYTKTTVSSEVAKALIREGWKKVDLHIHSACSYDVPPVETMRPEILFDKAKSQRLDFVTFTDHDTVKAYDLLGWDRPGLVPGVEITLKDLKRQDIASMLMFLNLIPKSSENWKRLQTRSGM